MNYTANQRAYYNSYRSDACKELKLTKYQFNQFRRYAEVLNQLYTMECNGFDNELQEAKNQELQDRFHGIVKALAETHKLYVYFQSDPRGASVYLDKQPIPYDNYTKAYAIY